MNPEQSEKSPSMRSPLEALVPPNRELRTCFEELSPPSGNEIDALAQIYARAFSGPPWFEKWTAALGREEILTLLEPEGLITVLRLQNEISAFAIGTTWKKVKDQAFMMQLGVPQGSFYLAEFAVEDTLRGFGLGRSILEEFDRTLSKRSVRNLFTRTRTDNIAAIRAFQRIGMQEIGRVQVDTGGVVSDRVVYLKSIPNCAPGL